ncbi:MAG: thioester domain-containing protein [Firmicutes bacterium]|nr:thioester domain-containing protein [Bacillota bacterium]
MTIRKGRCLRGLVVAVLACCMILLLAAVTFAEETEGVVSEEHESAASEVTECAAVDAPVAEATAVSDEKTGGESLKDQGVEEVNEAYDYTVETGGDSVGASAGISYGGWASLGSKLSYMKFPEGTTAPDGSDGIWCYCIDISTDTKDGHKYAITTLDAAGYYDETAAAKIRSILLNSYPNMTIKELEEAYGLSELMEEEAFMATQWILWYYSNPDGMVDAGGGKYYPADIYKPSEFAGETIRIWYDDEAGNEVSKRSPNVVKLAKALDDLEPADAYKTEPADIMFEKTVFNDKVIFDYSSSVGLETLENVKVTVKDKKGKSVPFTIKGSKIVVLYEDVSIVDGAAELTVSLKADQRLSKDVYFFSPEGGRDASQSRVSAYEGIAPVAKDAVFALTKDEFEEAEDDPEEPTDPTTPEDPEGSRGDVAEISNDKSPETGDGFRTIELILAMMMLMALAMIRIVRTVLFTS